MYWRLGKKTKILNTHWTFFLSPQCHWSTHSLPLRGKKRNKHVNMWTKMNQRLSVYRKTTHSDQHLNFHFNLRPQHNRAVDNTNSATSSSVLSFWSGERRIAPGISKTWGEVGREWARRESGHPLPPAPYFLHLPAALFPSRAFLETPATQANKYPDRMLTIFNTWSLARKIPKIILTR